MISATRFEPATYGLEVRCSDPLSYADISANGRVLNIRGMFAQHRLKRSGDFEPAVSRVSDGSSYQLSYIRI